MDKRTASEDASKKVIGRHAGIEKIMLYAFIFLCFCVAMSVVVIFYTVKVVARAIFIAPSAIQRSAHHLRANVSITLL